VETVFVVQHVHTVSTEDDENEDIKLVGVYSTELRARDAIARLSSRPGFRDHLDGFHITEQELDKDEWTEGFISWREAIEG
jgi:hypothetical protein